MIKVKGRGSINFKKKIIQPLFDYLIHWFYLTIRKTSLTFGIDRPLIPNVFVFKFQILKQHHYHHKQTSKHQTRKIEQLRSNNQIVCTRLFVSFWLSIHIDKSKYGSFVKIILKWLWFYSINLAISTPLISYRFVCVQNLKIMWRKVN